MSCDSSARSICGGCGSGWKTTSGEDLAARSSCGGSGSGWKTCSGEDLAADPISPPQLRCACKIPLAKKISRTPRNPDREYYQCQKVGTNEKFTCKTWIWVDLVREYVELMVKFRHNQELAAIKMELADKIQSIVFIERKFEEQSTTHQVEIRQLKREVAALQSQIARRESASIKQKKLRMVIFFAAMFWFIAPASSAFAAIVIAITVLIM